MLGANLDECRGRIGGQRGRECLGEVAQRGVNDDTPIGRPGRQIDGIEFA
jgi:hypothetical protein